MSDSTGRKTAGAFDVRNIIGGLLGIYGVILTLMGLFADPEEGKTGGINANLWAGLALVAASAIFFAWWRLRPIVVPDDGPGQDHSEMGHGPRG
jgi:hypothetical protein